MYIKLHHDNERIEPLVVDFFFIQIYACLRYIGTCCLVAFYCAVAGFQLQCQFVLVIVKELYRAMAVRKMLSKKSVGAGIIILLEADATENSPILTKYRY